MSSSVGLTGLNAASAALEVAGQNIANANTTGYKAHVLSLAAMSNNGLKGGGQAGVEIARDKQNFAQGTLTTTTSPLDLAVNGEGFYRMIDSSNGSIYYTRAGSFNIDSNKYLTNDLGQRLSGYNATNGVLNNANIGPLKIDGDLYLANKTSNASVNVNLNAQATVPASATFSPANTDSYNYSTSIDTYDAQGVKYNFTLYFVKSATADTWQVHTAAGLPGATPTVSSNVATISFNPDGTLDTSAGHVSKLLAVPIDTKATPDTAVVDLSEMTQVSSINYTNGVTQDGYPLGLLSGYKVNAEGIIEGSYTNGKSGVVLGQIALAKFNAPTGLQEVSDKGWIATLSSGSEQIGTPGDGAFGGIQASTLEASNVDLTAELVNLLAAQRSYQANAQTIKAQDQLQQTAVSIGR